MPGVTTTGFDKKILADILQEIGDDQRANINAALNLLPDTVLGQLNGIIAERLAELWDVSNAVYASFNPEVATGAALDAIGAITGVTRLGATRSELLVTITGTNGTLIPEGSVVSVTGSGVRFASSVDATISGGSINVIFFAEETGPFNAPPGTLTIQTPIAGWATASNATDVDPIGRNIETDADYRLRRLQLLSVTGAATLEAIRSALLATENVTEALVFENITLVVDVNGLPGKSFECVVQGGTDADIRETIFLTKPVGIESHGAVTGSVTDSQGFSHTIKFTRPTEVPVYFDLDITVNSDFGGGSVPVGEQQVKDAISAYIESLFIGDDVIRAKAFCAALDVPGVLDVTSFFLDDTPSPVSTANIVIALRDLATVDDGDIAITTTVV